MEIDAASWTMLRRIPTGDGVYNLAVTHDGRLLIGTNKRGQSVGIIDLASRQRVARVDVGQQACGIDFWKSGPAQ